MERAFRLLRLVQKLHELADAALVLEDVAPGLAASAFALTLIGQDRATER